MNFTGFAECLLVGRPQCLQLIKTLSHIYDQEENVNIYPNLKMNKASYIKCILHKTVGNKKRHIHAVKTT